MFGALDSARPNNTKDPDNFIYSGWGIGFDHNGTFGHSEVGTARNIIIFGGDISGSVHASNKTKDFLVLGRGLIQLIENTAIYAEKTYSPNISAENKIFVFGTVFFVCKWSNCQMVSLKLKMVYSTARGC